MVYGPRLRLCLGEDVRECGVIGRDLCLDRVALGLSIEVLTGEFVRAEVEIDRASDGPFEQVIAGHADDQVVAAIADQGVVVGVADHRVVVRAAQHVIDGERIGQGQGERTVIECGWHHGLGPGLAEIDRDPGRGLGEIEAGDGVAR